MADLIDRAALFTDIDETIVYSGRIGTNAEMRGANKIVDRIKAAKAVDAVEVVKSNEEIEKAISVLNVYRNTYYKEPSGTVKYAVADAINTILPLFAKCLERRTDA